ncbi:MAG TPA: aminotransferase class V-fold PLP-dependent enzyme [Pirellulaceae bacterium]|jgi:isopenicillin-N epimerase
MNSLDPTNDAAWQQLKAEWNLRSGTTYLNHGSFGPPPRCVREARQKWQDAIDSQPMDFFVRQLDPAWRAARDRLAVFVGSPASDLIFVENATAGMNIIADSFPLAAGDEVLLTDHEYGAVHRIWQRASETVDAKTKIADLPLPFRSIKETVDAIFAAATNQTRLIVVSHITSPTAVIFPVAEICRQARQRGIAVVIDGPHAVAQIPLDIQKLDCDFYTASCHKWLSGPFGSGFLYSAPHQQQHVRPPVLSWGRLPPNQIDSWSDEFVWSGTRNPVAYLAVPAAIDFLENIGLEAFRARTHWLAQYARRKLTDIFQLEPIVPDDPAWYGSMAHVPLSPTTTNETCAVANPLQHTIWKRFGIEVPIVDFAGRRYIRVSCHLYTDTQQIDRLAIGLKELLAH